MNYLFLYTRLPDYFFRCIRYLLETSPAGSKAWIVCYQQDKNAPYEFETTAGNIVLLNRQEFEEAMVDSTIRPHMIYMAGWNDQLYNRIGKRKKHTIPVVMGLDNPWKGNVRQQISSFLSPFFQQKICSHIWVAGLWQYEYARRLGFPSSHIITGLYCAAPGFSNASAIVEKRVIFVGRLVAYKRPDWLLKAFSSLQQAHPALNDWKLTIIGNGPMREQLQKEYGQLPQVELIPFLQPSEIRTHYGNAAVFCLPSHYEHWGVVVQEAAAAGLPLLLSDTCGASTAFLVNGLNGYRFASTDYEDFQNKLFRLMSKSTEALQKMGEASIALSKQLNHEWWAGALRSVLVNQQQHA